MNMTTLAFVMIALVCSGCSAPRVVGGRVPLISYSSAFMVDTAKEMRENCDKTPRICQMVTDYGKTREAIRAIDRQMK